MNRRQTPNLLPLALAALLFAPAAFAEQDPRAEEARLAAREAFEQAISPGEPHRYLARMEGRWTFTTTLWPAPSAPAVEYGGEAEKSMILGGRYLQEDMRGEIEDQSFIGRGVTGFDNLSGEFVNTWMDTLGTTIVVTRGGWLEEGESHELRGELRYPGVEEPVPIRTVTRIVDDDHHVFEYYVTPPGAQEEVRQLRTEFVRKGAEAEEEPEAEETEEAPSKPAGEGGR